MMQLVASADNVEPISAEAQTPLRALRKIVADMEAGTWEAKAMVIITAEDVKEGHGLKVCAVGCTALETVGLIAGASHALNYVMPFELT